MIQKFRKKPVVIEAVQYTGDNDQEVIDFTNGTAELQSTVPFSPEAPDRDRGYVMQIPTLEGNHICSPNDWVIKGVKGEFYPCKPDIFAATYEAVQ